jgi:uncharacterized protein YyaL (SSP411 family)
VPVKIDRELHGTLDSYLIDFVENAPRGAPGWPLNVFLTPDGHPLIGVTYLPPDGFEDFLARVDMRPGARAGTQSATWRGRRRSSCRASAARSRRRASRRR